MYSFPWKITLATITVAIKSVLFLKMMEQIQNVSLDYVKCLNFKPSIK